MFLMDAMGMKIIGSQCREKLAQTDYNLVDHYSLDKNGQRRPGWCLVLLQDKETGHIELWFLNDHAACYVIEIRGKGYEFAREVEFKYAKR